MWPEYVCQDLRDRAGSLAPGSFVHTENTVHCGCILLIIVITPLSPHPLQSCYLMWSLQVNWDQGVQGYNHIKSLSSGHLRMSSGLRTAAVDTAGALGQERHGLAWPPRKRAQARWGV